MRRSLLLDEQLRFPTMRGLLVFSIGLTLAAPNAGTLRAQGAQQTQTARATDDTLIVGTTTLKLGMAKDDVVRMLSLQYDLKSEIEIPDKLRPEAPETIEVRAGTQNLIALVRFDIRGVLEWASKFWTPDTSRHYSDGEIGRVIFSLWGTLPNGVGCKFIASQQQLLESSPPFKPSGDRLRDAHIECGHKRITFSTSTFKGEDSLSITEEIDSKSILERP